MRRVAVRAAIATAWIAAIVALIALGTWQIERRTWKLALIARVEAGLKAAPTPAPPTAGPDEAYRRVTASGRYLSGADTFVQASTVRGPGWWVVTPLESDTGRTILVNRGYVAERRAAPPDRSPLIVTGLLRRTEPGGGFLRANDPAADRWFSRDVAAIAAKRRLATVAYFIDADATRNAPGQPEGGLTVVRFANNHLVYAITWYVLAMMAAAGFLYWITLDRRGARA